MTGPLRERDRAAAAARSPLVWLELAAAVAVGVCLTLGHTGAAWLLAGVWLLLLIGDLASRPSGGSS